MREWCSCVGVSLGQKPGTRRGTEFHVTAGKRVAKLGKRKQKQTACARCPGRGKCTTVNGPSFRQQHHQHKRHGDIPANWTNPQLLTRRRTLLVTTCIAPHEHASLKFNS